MDTFSAQAWADLESHPAEVRARLLTTRAQIVFKPDAICARLVGPALEFLEEAGLTYHCATPIRFRRVHAELLWSKQIASGAPEWLDWVDLLFESRFGLIVSVSADASVKSALEQLIDIKPALRAWCGEHSFRPDEAAPKLLNFFHCADSADEQVRELAVLLGSRERRAFIARSAADVPSRYLETVLSTLYSQVPAHDLSVPLSIQRLRGAGVLDDELLTGIRDRESDAWWEARRRCTSAVTASDLLVVGAAYLTKHGDEKRATSAARNEGLRVGESAGSCRWNSEDAFYRRGVTWLERHRAADWLNRTALCVLKPEAFVTLAAGTLVTRMLKAGFKVVGWRSVEWDRTAMRTLWMHNLSTASSPMLDTFDYIGSLPPVLLVMLEDLHPAKEPASVRLNGRKGPRNPAERRPDDLRWGLPIEDGVLNFIHCAESPEAVLRQLAILFDETERSALLDEVLRSQDRADTLFAAIEETTRLHNPRDLRLESCRGRLLQAAPQLADSLDLLREGHAAEWQRFVSLADTVAASLDVWDLIVVSAHALHSEAPTRYIRDVR
jgi:nucleoside diphosphate kinase